MNMHNNTQYLKYVKVTVYSRHFGSLFDFCQITTSASHNAIEFDWFYEEHKMIWNSTTEICLYKIIFIISTCKSVNTATLLIPKLWVIEAELITPYVSF